MSKRILHFSLIVLCLVLGLVPVTAQQAEGDLFPVTVEHKFGATTIMEAPQRVVAIGYTEQDFLLALGVQPVAVRYWYGDEDNAVFPWALDALTGDSPLVLNMPFGNLNYEAILALQPDLISAVTAGLSAEEYETLSQIAPTVAQSGDYIDFGMPWQAIMQMIGDAVGQSDEAAAIIAETEALFETARADNPNFEGKTVASAYYYGDTYGFYMEQDSRGRFFTDLGFVIPEEFTELAGDSFYFDISLERVDLLDQDLIAIVNLQFIEGGRETLETDPIFAQLTAVQDGRVLYFDETAENALGFSSPLSLAYALDAALPQLEAMFGDAMAACDEGLRPVTDATGASVCVPENPIRIVALSEVDIDALLTLDIEPLAVTNGRGQMTPPRFLSDALPEGVVSTGTFFQPNLEVILAQNPDLILFAGFTDPDVLAQLNAIAPVYNAATFAESWQTHLIRLGDVLNLQTEADAVIETYQSRIDDLRDRLGDALGSEVAVVRWVAEGPQIMVGRALSTLILEDLGFNPPSDIPSLQEGHAHTPPLSLEELAIIDVDWVFIGTLQGEGEAFDALEFAIESPLFQSLDIVINERVFLVDGSIWTSVGGYIGATIILDDIEAIIIEGQ